VDTQRLDRLEAVCKALDEETVQLCYEIAVQGRKDLVLAPDEHAGFVMTLLRMLAFRPERPGAVSLQKGSPEGR